MPYPLPLTRTEAYLAYKAGVIQQSDLKPSLAIPRNGIDAWLAYWTGLAADYPKREDGTPHILQEEEAYIAYLCGIINEYPEKCLRRVGAYLRYLISARWGRPDHPLNREELYLSLLKTQVIPSGDPSSDIEIDGTAKAAFQDVKVYGDTSQELIIGKNLLSVVPWENGDSGKGLVTTYNATTGEINVTGTPTQQWVDLTMNMEIPDEHLLSIGSQVTLSVDRVIGDGIGVMSRLRQESEGTNDFGTIGVSSLSSTKTIKTVVPDKTQIWLNCGTNWSSLSNIDITFKLQMELGDTPTAFEVYQEAAPNPGQREPIKLVTGRQVVTVHSKNLLNPTIKYPAGEPEKVGGVDFVINSDGSIVFDGTVDNTNNVTMFGGNQDLHIPTEAGKRYYALVKVLGGEVTTVGDLQLAYECRYNGGSRVYYRATPLTGNTQVISMDTTNTEYLTRIRFYAYVSGGRVAPVFDNWKVQIAVYEEDDTTEYYQYSSNDYEINLGKNLLDIPTGYTSGLINGNTGELSVQSDFTLEVGEGYIKSITTSTTDGNYRGYVSDKLPLEPGKYILSFDRLDTANHSVGAFAYDAFGTFISRLGVASGTDATLAFTVNTNVAYVRLVFETALKGTTVTFSNIQLERGTTKSNYAAYFAPIELGALSAAHKDYDDYIYEEDGQWKIHEAVGKYRFDGSPDEGWFLSGNTDYAFDVVATNIYANFGIKTPNNSDKFETKLDYFIFARLNDGLKTGERFALYSGNDWVTNMALSFSKSRNIDTVEKAKAWLGNAKPKFVYPKFEESDTVITNQNLIAQLNALKQGGAEDFYTYIKVNATDPDKPALLVVEAPKYE